MKTNKKDRPLHLHFEYFFRKQYCLLIVLALMMVAIVKSDGRLLGMMRDVYAHGFGMVGAYMREETTRIPITMQIARVPTISGK